MIRQGFLLFFVASLGFVYGQGPASVLVLVNDETPREAGTGKLGASRYVAEHYAAARGVPAANIIHLKIPLACCESDPHAWDSWNISWENFDALLRAPLKKVLEKRGKASIKYIVPTYGIPSHITGYKGTQELSVDAFLAAMYSPQADELHSKNPYFHPNPVDMPEHIASAGLGFPMYAVVRLDGPSAPIAAALVDKAMAAEKGIARDSGKGYFDLRHLEPPGADASIRNAYTLCRRSGFECVLNDQAVTKSMITSAPNTLWAWGWYSGPNTHDVYQFVPGAVGAQLTSYTANSIREMKPGTWVPLWLERGITATWGATGEPYTIGYALGDVLLHHLWSGYTFGESAYIACPQLGWMMVFVGDPLYKPVLVDTKKSIG